MKISLCTRKNGLPDPSDRTNGVSVTSMEQAPDGSLSIRHATENVSSPVPISCLLNAAVRTDLILSQAASATAALRANFPGEQPSRFRNAVLKALADL